MFARVADLRRQAEGMEADLTARVSALAGWIDPPFTAAKRREITRAMAEIAGGCAALHRVWGAQMMTDEARDLPFGHPDRGYFAGLGARLQVWWQTAAILARVVSAKPRPLLARELPADHPVQGQLRAYQQSMDGLHTCLSPTPPDLYSPQAGRHGDLPYPFTRFFQVMQGVRRVLLAQGRRRVSFLDVGCGVGLKLVQAAQFFDVVHGFDFDPDRAAVAQRLAQRPQDRGFCADALTFDGYGDFDVIYAYKPLSDPDLLMAMERRILEQVKPGALLILPYFEFEFRFEDMGCTRLFDRVFLTGGAGQDVAPLLRRAGQVGTVMTLPDTAPPADHGFAAPARAALRHWGHLA